MTFTDASTPPVRAPLRVLVVDDELEIAELVRDMLHMAAYEVETVSTGSSALQRLREAHFDAVVADLHMPGLDGMAMWRELGRVEPALARRMLFVTGDTLSREANRFFAESGCPSLDKPFRKADLLARVAERVGTA